MRLLQILALTALCLIGLKLAVLSSAGVFDGIAVTEAVAQENAANSANNAAPQASADGADDEAKKEAARREAAAQEAARREAAKREAEREVENVQGVDEIQNRSSRSSIASRLGERRESLDKREQDLKLREQLLKAAEERLKNQIAKLKRLEAKEKKEKSEGANKASKDLVTIYENMKPKDAARIFNSLSLDILHMLATSINPRKMSAILAEMDVKPAERLTVEIALRAAKGGSKSRNRALSKIGG